MCIRDRPKPETLVFWGIGLTCYMTNLLSSFYYFDFMMDGKINSRNGVYTILALRGSGPQSNRSSFLHQDNESAMKHSFATHVGESSLERRYLYLPFVNHSGIVSLHFKPFFHICRLMGVSFDLEAKKGITFILPDTLQCGMLSILAIASGKDELFNKMLQVLDFLTKTAGDPSYKDNGFINDDLRNDCVHFSSIYSAVKMSVKQVIRGKAEKKNYGRKYELLT
eukprot:TRINITY_DN12846_c0_g1_i1.p1 TRINITY_DN12846_c0_g1~~TRINITY_DN12846_c0_g1_i1.p1  ORF type:complete len:224 (+),score=19.67 TRINITY_DN12846_c0_g1_i1:64-735(+)